MEIGKRIYELRKAKGMTQEQLAEAVGVSVPAVSKWETGNSLPDITMLSPVARMLGTSVDYLLAYTMELTEEETEALYKEIKAECDRNGFRKGMDFAFSLLKQYPGSDFLKLKIAMGTINLSYSMDDGYREEEYERLCEKSIKLLESLTNSANPEIGFAAKFALASRYLTDQKLKEAEELLNSLPKTEYSAKRLWPSLYAGKEEYEKSLGAAEQNLLWDIRNVLTDIMSMYTVRVKQEDYKAALFLAENYNQVRKLYGKHMPSGADMFVNIYLKLNDMENALKWFRIYVEEIIALDMDFTRSEFFKDTGKNIIIDHDLTGNIKTALFKGIILNPHYEILRNKEEYIEAMSKLKSCLKE